MASRKLICVLLLVGLLLCLCNLGICKEIHDEQNKENLESSSWAGWAKDKISEGLGFKSSDDDDSTMEAAKSAKDKITDTAADFESLGDNPGSPRSSPPRIDVTNLYLGTGHYVADKAGDLKNTAEEAKNRAYETAESEKQKAAEEAYSKAGEAKEKAYSDAEKAKQTASEKAQEASAERTEEAKGKMKETGEKAAKKTEEAEEYMNWAKEGYESAKNKAGVTLEKAKESVASNLESAKEKVTGKKRDDEL